MGGIEKFNRAFMKALSEEIPVKEGSLQVMSCYDGQADPNYFTPSSFKGFKGNRIWFTIQALLQARQTDIIILGHINLAIIGLCIKYLFPSKKVLLIAHGIEVWNIRSMVKKAFTIRVDCILAVSQFTADKIMAVNKSVHTTKISLFYNTLDPFFNIPIVFEKPDYLQKRYDLSPESKVILTIARLSNTEQYKGYDKVIQVMPQVLKAVPNAVYLLCGKYDVQEKARIEKLIIENSLEGKVIMPGFIADTELIDHYLLADVFIMPSKKEGFGIVFIEAMACGADVIAGNQDGSAEALLHGNLGTLVDPDNALEIEQALIQYLLTTSFAKRSIQQTILQHFSFAAYKKRLRQILKNKIIVKVNQAHPLK